MNKLLIGMLAAAVLCLFLAGCAATVYAPGPPPPAKAEVTPAAPGPNALWVTGNWYWNGNEYVWKSGHWVKNPQGRWVAGHWKKTARGHTWVAGHWTH